MKNVTRKDIAEKLGVSVSVVSRVINNSGYVSKEKREKVLKAAKEMGYVQNPVAMALQQNKTKQLLFFCEDLTSTYYNQMYHGMVRAAKERGYHVLTVMDENDFEIMELLKDRKAIVLLNKSDLTPVTDSESIRKHLDKKMIAISAKEQTGIEELEETIREMFFTGEVTFNDEVYITNIRHKTALQEARNSLNLVVQSILDGMPEDFYSIDLMNAYEELGSIVGEAVEDDLVNEIFSKFCMGK